MNKESSNSESHSPKTVLFSNPNPPSKLVQLFTLVPLPHNGTFVPNSLTHPETKKFFQTKFERFTCLRPCYIAI